MAKRKSAAIEVFENEDGELVIRQHVFGTDDTFVCVPLHQVDWLIEQIREMKTEMESASKAGCVEAR